VLITFAAPLQQPTEWQHTGNQIDTTMIFVQFTLHRINFQDLGVHQLKGLPGEWKLFSAN
jgi:hypothetical protein